MTSIHGRNLKILLSWCSFGSFHEWRLFNLRDCFLDAFFKRLGICFRKQRQQCWNTESPSYNSLSHAYNFACRVHIDYALSILDSSTLRYRVTQRSNDIIQERTTRTCVARPYRPNAHTGNNNLRDGHFKGPDIRPVGDRVLPWPCLLTHILFDLYFAHSTYSQVSTSSLFKSSRRRRRQRWGSRASWVAGTAMPFPPHTVSGQQTSDSGKLVDNIGQHVSCYLNYPEWNGNHTLISDLPNLWRLVDDVAVAY